MARSWLTAISVSWVQAILLSLSPKELELQAMCHHAWLIFLFLVEMGFHDVGQSGLELLTSGNPPASASQSAVLHHTLFYIVRELSRISVKVVCMHNGDLRTGQFLRGTKIWEAQVKTCLLGFKPQGRG